MKDLTQLQRSLTSQTDHGEKLASVVPRQGQVLLIDCEPRTASTAPLGHILAYQNLNASQLAERFGVPHTWILENSKRHVCRDPIPHIHLGKQKRYRWGSPDLAAWIERHVIGCRSVSRPSAQEVICYEFLDSAQLAERLNISESWVREQVRSRTSDPIPHVQLGKYIRFRWGSPELESWAECRMLTGNNRTVGRAPRKEKVS